MYSAVAKSYPSRQYKARLGRGDNQDLISITTKFGSDQRAKKHSRIILAQRFLRAHVERVCSSLKKPRTLRPRILNSYNPETLERTTCSQRDLFKYLD